MSDYHYLHVDSRGNMDIRPGPLPTRWNGVENFDRLPAADIAAAGWRLCFYADVPTGGVITSETWDIGPEIAQQVITTRPSADVEAEAEAARIAGLAAQYGGSVGTLSACLAAFNLSMPITAPEAMPTVYAAWKADASKGPDATMLLAIYGQLSGVLTDHDIYAVAKAIGVAQ